MPTNTGRKRPAPVDLSNSGGRAASKKPREDQGHLKSNKLEHLPLRVIHGIYSYLLPFDLLHLAQTSKDFRGFLMTRDNVWVWKQARANVPGLPDCPLDLAEPEYAVLCFEKHCTGCIRNVPSHHIWGARVRLCKRCIDSTCVSRIPHHLEILVGFHCIPSVMLDSHTEYYYRPDIEKLEKAAKALEDNSTLSSTSIAKSMKDKTWHGSECERWYWKQKDAEVHQCRQRILNHARGLGWDSEVEKGNDFALEALKENPILEKACNKKINPQVLKKLEPEINKLMTSVRAHIADQDKKGLLESRLPVFLVAYKECVKGISPTTAFPSAREFFEIPMVHALVMHTPTSTTMTQGSFKPILAAFPALLEQWQETRQKDLATIARSCLSSIASSLTDSNMLNLAAMVFGCKRCNQFLSFPRAMIHSCGTSVRPRTRSDPKLTAEEWALRKLLRSETWNAEGQIYVDPGLVKMLGDVVKLCGSSRRSATAADLQSADPVVECISCHQPTKGRFTMSWSTVIHHWKSKHEYGSKMVFKLLNEQDTSIVRKHLVQSQEKAEVQLEYSICATCRHEDTVQGLKKHRKTEHKRAAVEGDILPHPDCEHNSRKTYYLWPPRDDDEPVTGFEIQMVKPTQLEK